MSDINSLKFRLADALTLLAKERDEFGAKETKLMMKAKQYQEALESIQLMVDAQAKDEGLWSVPVGELQSIVEAYLQQELRRLHGCIEHYTKAALSGGEAVP